MTKKHNEEKINVIPLGGLGEVGRNMTVFEYKNEYLIVDCGILFPENDMIGVDYIIPDMQYLNDKKDKIAGVILTHGHEDHIGGVPYLFDLLENVPIYTTPLTAEMVELKLARGGRLSRTSINVKQAGDCFEVGPFHIEIFHMSHSIPDSVGVAIETGAGLIVMSGDYKFDQTPIDHWPSDFAKLAELGKQLVRIDKWFASSKTCHVCGYVNRELALGTRSWECPECHTMHDRDKNAAVNIKREGMRMLFA